MTGLRSGPPPPCLGEGLAALVDGELDHAARERLQAHLAHCAGCRAEVDAQRRLKGRLGRLGDPPLAPELTARLLALAVPGVEPAGPPREPVRAAGLRRTPRRPARFLSRGPRRPGPPAAGIRRPSRRRRRTAVGGTLLVLSLGAALALGGPRTGHPSVPLDPGTDVFVADYAGTAPGPLAPVPVSADLVWLRR